MPISEKEYNGYLFDQLSLLERLERVAKKEGAAAVLAEIEFERFAAIAPWFAPASGVKKYHNPFT